MMRSRFAVLTGALIFGLSSLVLVHVAAADDLPPPESLEVVLTGANQVRLTWKPVNLAKQYLVTRDPKPTDTLAPWSPTPPEQNPVIFAIPALTTNLNPATPYTFTVTSIDDKGKQSQVRSQGVTIYVPDTTDFLQAPDLTNPSVFPENSGSWIGQAGGGISQQQEATADVIRKKIFNKAGEAADQARIMIKAKVRIDTAVAGGTAYVGLGLNSDPAKGYGYGFVFETNGYVAFINDRVGAAGTAQLGADGKTTVATNQPLVKARFPFDWKIGKDYWVVFARNTDTPRKTDLLMAKVWQPGQEEPKFWQFQESVDELTEPIKVAAKAAGAPDASAPATKAAATPTATATAETTARMGGFPSLIGGYDQAVKSTFGSVLILRLPGSPPIPIGMNPATPHDAVAAEIKQRSRDSFSRLYRVWRLTDDPEDTLDPEEQAFEPKTPGPQVAQTARTPDVQAPSSDPKPLGVAERRSASPSIARLVFDGPARFPLPEFGTCGEVFEEDVAVIHEGMRFVANDQGDYLVRFNISAPAMPVQLRLQLVLQPTIGSPISLTLPPIRIDPAGASPEFYKSETYGVSVPGYSDQIRLQYAGLLGANALPHPGASRPQVSRSGTARFGVRRLSPLDSINN